MGKCNMCRSAWLTIQCEKPSISFESLVPRCEAISLPRQVCHAQMHYCIKWSAPCCAASSAAWDFVQRHRLPELLDDLQTEPGSYCVDCQLVVCHIHSKRCCNCTHKLHTINIKPCMSVASVPRTKSDWSSIMRSTLYNLKACLKTTCSPASMVMQT